MHSVLFVARLPTGDGYEARQQWGMFVGLVDRQLGNAKNAARLGENVWLVNVRDDVGPLGRLIAEAEDQKIVYGLLPFESAPQMASGRF